MRFAFYQSAQFGYLLCHFTVLQDALLNAHQIADGVGNLHVHVAAPNLIDRRRHDLFQVFGGVGR